MTGDEFTKLEFTAIPFPLRLRPTSRLGEDVLKYYKGRHGRKALPCALAVSMALRGNHSNAANLACRPEVIPGKFGSSDIWLRLGPLVEQMLAFLSPLEVGDSRGLSLRCFCSQSCDTYSRGWNVGGIP
jgi:hypothetical protein